MFAESFSAIFGNATELIGTVWTTRIDQFRYIKIQPKTIDLSTRLGGINPTNSVIDLRIEVYCFRLNFNISKLVHYFVSYAVDLPENIQSLGLSAGDISDACKKCRNVSYVKLIRGYEPRFVWSSVSAVCLYLINFSLRFKRQ